MIYSQPITKIISQRFSCRSYLEKPLAEDAVQRLQDAAASSRVGPLGAPVRLKLVAASAQDSDALKGLGTYGFIKGASGFTVGAVEPAGKALEDCGYLLEQIVLLATDLGLGTCWLGGSFTRGGFAAKIAATSGEQVPAVISVGYIADTQRAKNGLIRRAARGDSRLPWGRLFFRGRFGVPLAREEAGPYAAPLEMVRLGPSASNKQPWRIVQKGAAWHFFLQRTAGYGKGLASRLLKTADVQRLDMGIAMCHLELTARELGLSGRWAIQQPAIALPDALTEYTVSWVS